MPEASSEYSTVVEDILKLVWSAEEAGRDGVKPKDIGEHMGVVPSTTTENVQRLARQGLVTHERYGRVRLTEEGRAVALGMVRRHRLLETYLHEALGFSWDEVHEEAEILEHAVSERLLDRLDKVLGYPTRDPHGDPIPRADGSSDEVSGVPLDSLAVGDGGLVERLPDRDPQALRAWEEVGLVPGVRSPSPSMMGRWCSWRRPWPRASSCAPSATRANEAVAPPSDPLAAVRRCRGQTPGRGPQLSAALPIDGGTWALCPATRRASRRDVMAASSSSSEAGAAFDRRMSVSSRRGMTCRCV